MARSIQQTFFSIYWKIKGISMKKFLKKIKNLNIKVTAKDSISAGKKDFYLETDKLNKTISLFKKEKARLITITAYSNPNDKIFICYHFDWKNSVFTVKTQAVNSEISSITEHFPAAWWIEREIYEMYGIKFIGHKKLTNLLLPKKIKTPFVITKKGKHG
jgi:NADH:ubiquinone oxidoreductase subunit C